MDLLILYRKQTDGCSKTSKEFQDSGYTYRQIADCCNEAYQKARMIMTAGKNVSVPGEAIWPGTG